MWEFLDKFPTSPQILSFWKQLLNHLLPERHGDREMCLIWGLKNEVWTPWMGSQKKQ